jgi:uncharacterized protein (TIGR02466 family)
MNELKNDKLELAYHFPTIMYTIDRPDFLSSVNIVSEEMLQVVRSQELNEIYPAWMSGNFFDDSRIEDFANFITSTSWNILNEQGYAMQDKGMYFMEMWTQEHFKHSAMDQHTHGFGSQITGFYFLETPDNCSRVVFHDPRSGKINIDLLEADYNNATVASRAINFTPRPGMFIFTNAWLSHSFTRHAANTSMKFVHFNLGTYDITPSGSMPAAEVV